MIARKNIIPVFIPHLGCPHDCVFCNQKRISGSLLPASPEDVTKTITGALAHCAGKPQVAFYGGSFTAVPAEEQLSLLSAAHSFIESGAVSDIRISTRPDAIDPETLEMLRRFGVSTIELGTQSMSDEVLLRSGRGHTSEDTRRAAGLIRQAGFKLILQMMTGLPGSSDENDILTAREIIALCPDGVRIYPTVIVRDTALFDLWQAGVYREHTVEDAVRVCAEILPMFEGVGIPVIRLGLNPTDDLSGGDAAGGAYHPALGEMVRSRIMLNSARKILRGVCAGASVVLGVSPSCVSQMTGQHRCNVKALCAEFGLKNLKIAEKDVERGKIEVISVAKDG